MSAFNAWLSKDKYVIATDTLCALKTTYGNIIYNFITKVYHLPQYKCCFSSQGLRNLGIDFFVYVQKQVKAFDFASLLVAVEQFQLSTSYDEVPHDKIGNIFLFGLNMESESLEMYKLSFTEDRKTSIQAVCENNDDYSTIFKPLHETINFAELNKQLKWDNLFNIYESLIKVTEEQKKAFDRNADPFIGGQIEVTIIDFSQKSYSTSTEIIHEFSDFKRVSQRIKNLNFISL